MQAVSEVLKVQLIKRSCKNLEGRMRLNMLGKRVNFSARTVSAWKTGGWKDFTFMIHVQYDMNYDCD